MRNSIKSVHSGVQVRLHLPASVMAACLMAACGGGGASDTPPTATVPTADATPTTPTTPVTPTTPTATTSTVLVTANSGKTAWRIATPISLTLKDASGTALTGPLTCTSDNPTTLLVAADCSTVTGQRLGAQTFTVSSASGVSAKASVKVIPQAQPLGSHGVTSQNNDGPFNLVVTQDGRVLAWGANAHGALGQGQSKAQLGQLSLPTAVKDTAGQGALKGIVAASAGSYSALALTEDGEVYSWGSNNQNVLGRDNGVQEDPLPGKVLSPTGTTPLQHIVAISIGYENALALSDEGIVYSWGYNSGQAGIDPKRVAGTVPAVDGSAPMTNAVAVSAGYGWSAVLLGDGRVVTWGYDFYGNLGRGNIATESRDNKPGYVMSGAPVQPITGVVALSTGDLFGLALTDSGQVLAWGNNWDGQIGQGNAANHLKSAVPVKDVTGTALLSGITMVAAGGNHALAMDGKGNVLSWGRWSDGALGDGPNQLRKMAASYLPAPVLAASGIGYLTDVQALAAGYTQSLAVTSDGSLMIWGQGSTGGLGQGSGISTDYALPLNVKDAAGTGTLSIAPFSYWPNLLGKAR